MVLLKSSLSVTGLRNLKYGSLSDIHNGALGVQVSQQRHQINSVLSPDLAKVQAQLAAAAPSAASLSGYVLMVGGDDQPEKQNFCVSLATRVRGTLLSSRSLLTDALQQQSADGYELRAIIAAGKIVPIHCMLKLFSRAMSSMPRPCILTDFPNTVSTFEAFNKAFGAPMLTLQLHVAGSVLRPAEERLVEVLKRVGRTHTVTVMEENAINKVAGMLLAGVSATIGVAPAVSEPGVSTTSGEVDLLMVIGGGEGVEKEVFCDALAARVDGSVLCIKKLLMHAMKQQDAQGEALRNLVNAGKLVPVAKMVELLTEVLPATRSPYVLSDFPSAKAQLPAFTKALGMPRCVIELQVDGVRARASQAKLLAAFSNVCTVTTGEDGVAAAAAAFVQSRGG